MHIRIVILVVTIHILVITTHIQVITIHMVIAMGIHTDTLMAIHMVVTIIQQTMIATQQTITQEVLVDLGVQLLNLIMLVVAQ